MKSNKQILMLVYGTVRDDPRVMNEARSLISYGYQVSAIGCPRDSQYSLPCYEQIDGIDVYMTPILAELQLVALLTAFANLLRGNLPEMTSTIATGRSSTRTLLNILLFNLWVLRLGLPLHVVHCHEPWPLPAAWIVSRRRGIALIYDAHEGVQRMRTWSGKVAAQIERLFVSQADRVITVGERLKQDLQKLGANNLEIIGNWKRIEDYRIDEYHLEQIRTKIDVRSYRLVISYIGLLFEHREILPLIEAIKKSEDILLIIAGRGDLRQQVMSASQANRNILYFDWIPLQDVPLYTTLSDAIYCCLSPDEPSMVYAVPNKLFEAFAAGKPMIATRGVGEMSDILEATGAGVFVETAEPESLITVFRSLTDSETMRKLSRNAQMASIQYNWSVAEERLRDLYHDLIGPPQPPPEPDSDPMAR